jgi:hypothetical protein
LVAAFDITVQEKDHLIPSRSIRARAFSPPAAAASSPPIAAAMSFEPKQKVELDAPKDDPISEQYLSKCDGPSSSRYSSPWLATPCYALPARVR